MKNITSFGEILFDVYPGKKKLGGAPFNFIYHIKKLTGSGNFVSRVGDDDLGKNILSLARSWGLESYIQIDIEHPTGTANANLDKNKIPHWQIELNRAYDFIENNSEIESLVEKESGCLYFGTLAQRNEKSRKTIRELFGKKIKYFCDLNIRQNFYSKEIIETSLTAADAVKLNMEELDLVNSLLIKGKAGLEETANQIMKIYKIDLLCITQGSGGAILFKGKETDHCKIEVDKIVDTVGAGDAFAAVLCLGFLEGWKISKLNKLASRFAAKVVGFSGALPEDDSIYNEVKKELLNERK
jgi:fructokinase